METKFNTIPISNKNTTMKKLLILSLFLIFGFQNILSQTIKNQEKNIVWVDGIPTCPSDSQISLLINKIGIEKLKNPKGKLTKLESDLHRKLGKIFNEKGMYEGADWYLERVKGQVVIPKLEPEVVFEQPKEEPEIPQDIVESLAKDKAFLQSLPQTYENVSPTDMKNLAMEIQGQLQKLIQEKESLIKSNASPEVIEAKNNVLNTLGKEKKIIDLNIQTSELKVETTNLKEDRKILRNYLIGTGITILLMILGIVVLIQRKTIKVQDKEIEEQLKEISKKNTYLEHAARIIRHDMHSGINTYIPKGISTLEKRITPEETKNLKIDAPLKMIKEGLSHTQRVYKSVYEFTNLVKQKVVLDKVNVNIKELLNRYLLNTSYKSQVNIEDLGELEVNETLFCNAIDNLIRNGLKYNNSEDKFIRIYKENNNIIIQDNGVGLTQKQFDSICFNYVNKKNKDIDKSTNGLGLNICLAILEEHGFKLTCERDEIGTKMIINLK